MSETPRTAYVTKWALSVGIKQVEIEKTWPNGDVRARQTGGHECYLSAGDYAFTMPEAIAQAEKKRLAKLKSLEKQADKLRALSFV